jgi:hypothetical protein
VAPTPGRTGASNPKRHQVIIARGFACIGFVETANAGSYGRFQPMTFALTNEGPAEACGTMCRQFLAASGTITADSSRQFLAFIRDNPVRDATVALESDSPRIISSMNSRARARTSVSIGSNQLSKRSTAISESGFVVVLVMAWSPVQRFNAG